MKRLRTGPIPRGENHGRAYLPQKGGGPEPNRPLEMGSLEDSPDPMAFMDDSSIKFACIICEDRFVVMNGSSDREFYPRCSDLINIPELRRRFARQEIVQQAQQEHLRKKKAKEVVARLRLALVQQRQERVKARRRQKELSRLARLEALPPAVRIKMLAYREVARALAVGKLVRPEKCQQCGRTGKVAAHHWDYSKPLEVEWLCYYGKTSCHWQADLERARRDARKACSWADSQRLSGKEVLNGRKLLS